MLSGFEIAETIAGLRTHGADRRQWLDSKAASDKPGGPQRNFTYLGFVQLPGGRGEEFYTITVPFEKKIRVSFQTNNFRLPEVFMSCPYLGLARQFFSLLFVLLLSLSIGSAAPSQQDGQTSIHAWRGLVALLLSTKGQYGLAPYLR